MIGAVTAESSTETYVESNAFSISSHKNMTINVSKSKHCSSDSAENIFLSGKYFVLEDMPAYYHALLDYLGAYLFVKKHYPEVKLLFIISEPPKSTKWFEFVSKYYPAEIISVGFNLCDSPDKIVLENVLFLNHAEMMPLDNGLLSQIRKLTLDQKIFSTRMADRPTRLDLAQAVVESIKSLELPATRKYPSKIYSIRNTKLHTDETVVAMDSDVYNSRIHSQEHKIAQYFSSIGYEIVDFGSLSMEEQIQYAIHSHSFAGMIGTNMVNAIFMNPGSKAIVLFGVNWYYYPYRVYYESLGIQYIPVNESVLINSGAIPRKSNFFLDSKLYQTPASEIIAQLKELML